MGSADPAISVSALRKSYGATRAVDQLDFEVGAGEVFGLLGPNGAGKTTTVEILEGYRRPDSGTVRVLGFDPVRDGRSLRPLIGVMLQSGGLYPGLRPLELLRLFASYYEPAEAPEALLELVGLQDTVGTPVRRLSGGQAQRLSLACALVGRPRVVFLDEPTAGMDPHARATTWTLVRNLKERGVTVLLTTHAMDEAETLCDRVAIITGGRLAALGSPDDLTRSQSGAEISFAADAGLDVDVLAKALGLDKGAATEVRPGEYVVRGHVTPARIADLAGFLLDRDATLTSLQSGQRSLEDVFLQITSEAVAPAPDNTVPAGRAAGATMSTKALVAQSKAELVLQLRRGENLIVTLAVPLGILVFFAKVDNTIPTDFKHPVDFLVPGVLSLAVMAAAMVSLGIATGFERRYGVLKRLGSTPLSRGGLLAAKTATVLLFELVEALLVVLTGMALGWHVPSGLVPAIGLLLLGTVAFAGIGLLMAGTLRAEANLAASNALFLVLLFLGGMAYPLAKLPGVVQAVAKALPAAALSDTVRSVLSTQAFPTGQLAVLVAWAVLAPVAAARWFRWEE